MSICQDAKCAVICYSSNGILIRVSRVMWPFPFSCRDFSLFQSGDGHFKHHPVTHDELWMTGTPLLLTCFVREKSWPIIQVNFQFLNLTQLKKFHLCLHLISSLIWSGNIWRIIFLIIWKLFFHYLLVSSVVTEISFAILFLNYLYIPLNCSLKAVRIFLILAILIVHDSCPDMSSNCIYLFFIWLCCVSFQPVNSWLYVQNFLKLLLRLNSSPVVCVCVCSFYNSYYSRVWSPC
jgi:hypothetical protein